MVKLLTRSSALILLIVVLSFCSLSGVWNYTAAQVDSRAEITIVAPEDALIATKDFSVRNDEVILNRKLTVRTTQVISMFPDGTSRAERSSDNEPARFTIQNNLSRPVEIDIEAHFSDVPSGLDVWIEPKGARIASGGDREFTVYAEDAVTPGADKTIDFTLPLTIEADWQGGHAEIEVVVPGRVVRRCEQVSVDVPKQQGLPLKGSGETESPTNTEPAAVQPQEANPAEQPARQGFSESGDSAAGSEAGQGKEDAGGRVSEGQPEQAASGEGGSPAEPEMGPDGEQISSDTRASGAD